MILVHMLFLCIAIYIYVACAVFHVLLLYVHIAYQYNQCMFSFIFTLHNCFVLHLYSLVACNSLRSVCCVFCAGWLGE